MNINNRTILWAATLIALISLPIVALATGGLRITVSLTVILFIPGYTLLAALFPKRTAMTAGERVALSIGLSLAIVPVIGLIMHFMPWGLTVYSVLTVTAIFVFITAAIAWYRDSRLPAGERLAFRLRFGMPKWHVLGKIERTLTITFGLLLLILAGVVTYAAATPNKGESYTEFYILDTSGTTEHYPEMVASGDPVSIIAGVINREAAPTGYTIEIRINGVPVAAQETGNLVQGQKWQNKLSFVPRNRGNGQKVELWLYKASGAQSYNKDPLFFNIDVS